MRYASHDPKPLSTIAVIDSAAIRHIEQNLDVAGAVADYLIENPPTGYTHPSTHPPSIIEETTDDRFVSNSETVSWGLKQDALVSGENIKTINSTSLLGSGDIAISGSGLSQQQIEGLI